MRLIRYLGFLVGQLVGFTVGTRRPGLILLVVLGALAVLIGLLIQVAGPVVVYPFL